MNPDDRLNRIREIIRGYREIEQGYHIMTSPYILTLEETDELIEHVEELDRWILSGGYLPRDWYIHTHPSTAPLESSDP